MKYLQSTYRRPWHLLDVSVALVLLLLAAVITVVWAIVLAYVSPGPVIYRQSRYGENGTVFVIYKLRTMHVFACDPFVVGHVQSQFTARADNDPRCFALGRFLSWTHLDELPQAINVLKGEMAIVGWRPLLTLSHWLGKPGIFCPRRLGMRWLPLELFTELKPGVIRSLVSVCVVVYGVAAIIISKAVNQRNAEGNGMHVQTKAS